MVRGLVRHIRLASGLVLFTFVVCHLANHALGLISLDAMNAGLEVFRKVWRNPVALALLAAALLSHIVLAMRSIYRRRTLRLRPWEWAQVAVGLLIPLILFEHILGTFVSSAVFDVDVYLQTIYWVSRPFVGVEQAVLLVLVWVHGCIGLHFWLSVKPWYGRALPYLYAGALLVPALSLAGYVASGFEMRALAEQDGVVEQVFRRANFSSEMAAFVADATTAVRAGFVALIALALGGRWLRLAIRRAAGVPRITYPEGRTVDLRPGATVLETSRAAGIPHASVCGGRGRCSTCRVRVAAGAAELPAAAPDEAKVLRRIGAPPDVRLACQLRPTHDLEVTPLLPAAATARDGFSRPGYLSGDEREIAILFADLRGFTTLSDAKLPYDVVFLLNRYFAAMGKAVEDAGGRIDKFIGDGVMALFGVESGAAEGCRRALAAARGMSVQLDELNRALADDLPAPLRMGIGIHVGPAIVGEMGYGRAKSLTAVGDAVNTASRLEGLTKEFGAQLVVSDAVARRAGIDLTAFEARRTELRGKKRTMKVRVLASAQEVPAGA